MVLKCKIKKAWIEDEMVHTKNRWFARKIAEDHVKEHGCGYYPALKKLEKRLRK